MRSSSWKIPVVIISVAAGIGLLIWFIVWLATPRPDFLQIQDYSWEREIAVQEKFTYEGEGWSVPVGARVEYQRDEIYEYDDESNPIYETYYFYYEEKWETTRSVVTSGFDKSPYWGDVTLWYGERMGSRSETYSARAVNSEGNIKTYTFDYADWERLEIGETYSVDTYVGGSARIKR